jgi:hypothetical protein
MDDLISKPVFDAIDGERRDSFSSENSSAPQALCT